AIRAASNMPCGFLYMERLPGIPATSHRSFQLLGSRPLSLSVRNADTVAYMSTPSQFGLIALGIMPSSSFAGRFSSSSRLREIDWATDFAQTALPRPAAECLLVCCNVFRKARARHLEYVVDATQALDGRQVGAERDAVDANQIDDVVEVPQEIVETRLVGWI